MLNKVLPRPAYAVLLTLCSLLAQIVPAPAAEQVGLELVLAVDVSSSVNRDEWLFQRSGIADAFRHPTVLKAIATLGEEGMAVAVVQWSGTGKQTLAVNWQRVNGEASAFAFADAVAAMPREREGFTDIAGALRFSTRQILTNGFDGRRLAIDVSGDGPADRIDPSGARDEAILEGITINGLVIHTVDFTMGDLARYELRTHYLTKVIGGPGAFLLNAESFRDFAVSMREKLVREITGPLFAAR